MPVKFGLWRVDGARPAPVPAAVIASENRLEEIIEAHIEILGLGSLLQIGRQVVTDFGKRIDLLAIDEQGDLHIIELKKDRTPRDVVAQALEYGFWVQGLSFEAIRELYGKHHDGEDFDSAFTRHFEMDVPESINVHHHLVIVAASMDASTEQIVEYVRGYGVPINVLFFHYLEDDGREYLARSWLTNPDLDAVTVNTADKKQPAWNGIDFYVAIEESIHRSWDDMRRYGFVSAGQGARYRNFMLKLAEGARVWAYVTGSGYVGVGAVTATAVGVNDFDVDLDGRMVPILDAPHIAEKLEDNADDPERCEYFTRVRWIDTRPRDRAVWAKGMFANPNVVTKLRHPFTLEHLTSVFVLDES